MSKHKEPDEGLLPGWEATPVKSLEERKMLWKKYSKIKGAGGYLGINNHKNHCYMISVLQCLSNIQDIHDFIIYDKARFIPDADQSVFKAFDEIIKTLWIVPDGRVTLESLETVRVGLIFFEKG